jgi:SpoVK/Ycf46/Vps4 family AAA+-type ATPase
VQDLDAALLSRCQSIITFGLPDTSTRVEILKHYAAHLEQQVSSVAPPPIVLTSCRLGWWVRCSSAWQIIFLECLQELFEIANISDGMSARDLRAICEVAERQWVSSIIRGSAPKDSLPPLSTYIAAAEARLQSLQRESRSPARKPAERVLQDSFAVR